MYRFFSSIVIFGVILTLASTAVGDLVTFNSSNQAGNASTRSDWLATVGISSPEFLVDFESGFSDGQNIHGLAVLPGGLVINDTGPGTPMIIIESGSGDIGGSNPVGGFSATQDEQAFLELDFSANPVDYVGLMDIDHTGTSGVVTFVGGTTANFSLDSTSGFGDTAEFFGIFRNDLPQITKVELNASGDGNWGVDNIEYGSIASVPEPSSGLFGVVFLLGLAGIRRRSTKFSLAC